MLTDRLKPILFFVILISCDHQDKPNVSHENSVRQKYQPWTYHFSSEIKRQFDTSKSESKCHDEAISYSNIGEYFKALASFDECGEEIGNQSVFYDSSNFKIVPAIDLVIKVAENTRIVIINEAHHVSYHRFFTMTLLEKLSKLGYNYFGAETLALWDSTLSKNNYPTRTTGFYSSEPQYSNLIREAIKTGFKVFAYEPNNPGTGMSREIGQAKNIKKILDNDPSAKIVIHCGYAHLYEDNVDGWGKAMAGRLIEYTGVDPLTIDQVELTEHSDPKYENPYYKKFHSKDFVVPVNNGKTIPISFRLGGPNSDVFVYHPRTHLVHNRPHWLFSFYTARHITKEINISFPVLVKAFVSTENENVAVPVDVIEIKNKTDSTALALIPRTSYKIVIENENNEKQTFELKVE